MTDRAQMSLLLVLIVAASMLIGWFGNDWWENCQQYSWRLENEKANAARAPENWQMVTLTIWAAKDDAGVLDKNEAIETMGMLAVSSWDGGARWVPVEALCAAAGVVARP